MNDRYEGVASILIAIFGVCVAIAILAQALKIKLPEKIQIFFGTIGGLSLIIAIVLYFFGDWKLREELRSIHAADITSVILAKDRATKTITEPSDILKLMSQLEATRFVFAHHSSPVDRFDISFLYEGQHFHYRFGRDSYRTNEFWVFNENANDTREIGRIESAEFGPLISNLLK